MKFEFKEINGQYAAMIYDLNCEGRDGWDIVSLMIRTDANTYRAVMKRTLKK